jgi:hypothetical protein
VLIDASSSIIGLQHQQRLYDSWRTALIGPVLFAAAPPSILVCIPNREHMIKLMLGSRWLVELDPEKADFVIESERWRCAKNHPTLILLDEVTRYNQAFAWIYVNERSRYLDLAFSHRVCCMPAQMIAR